MDAIEYAGASYTYPTGTQALRDVSLCITEGQATAIIGQNGAGKTTLVKLSNGLLHPTGGSVRLFGQDVAGKTTAALSHQIGFVFQNPRTQIFLGSVQAEVAFGPKNLGFPPEQVQRQVEAALEQVGLGAKRDTHPYELTPVERKLLTIASIISMEPRVLILDEPTGGLDTPSVDKVARVVEQFKGQGRTVLTVTHDMDFVARCFERVVVMSQGQVVADGPTREVFSQHERLAETHLEPTAISALAAATGLPKTLITVPGMVEYLEERE